MPPLELVLLSIQYIALACRAHESELSGSGAVPIVCVGGAGLVAGPTEVGVGVQVGAELAAVGGAGRRIRRRALHRALPCKQRLGRIQEVCLGRHNKEGFVGTALLCRPHIACQAYRCTGLCSCLTCWQITCHQC